MMRRGLAAWLEVYLPVAFVSALRLERLSCRQQRAVHTPDPRAPDGLCCTAKAVFAVRFVTRMFMLEKRLM